MDAVSELVFHAAVALRAKSATVTIALLAFVSIAAAAAVIGLLLPASEPIIVAPFRW